MCIVASEIITIDGEITSNDVPIDDVDMHIKGNVMRFMSFSVKLTIINKMCCKRIGICYFLWKFPSSAKRIEISMRIISSLCKPLFLIFRMHTVFNFNFLSMCLQFFFQFQSYSIHDYLMYNIRKERNESAFRKWFTWIIFLFCILHLFYPLSGGGGVEALFWILTRD